MILTLFGSAWIALAGSDLSGGQPLVLLAVALAVVAMCWLALRHYLAHRRAYRQRSKLPAAKRVGRFLGAVNLLQWLVIIVAANVLHDLGQDRWILDTVILVVGLHFIALAWDLRCEAYYYTATALVVLALAYPVLAPGGAQSSLGPLGAGLILWATALARCAKKPGVLAQRTAKSKRGPPWRTLTRPPAYSRGSHNARCHRFET
jgi:hypothetical protein